jgi:parallel beta-helix repeat protein
MKHERIAKSLIFGLVLLCFGASVGSALNVHPSGSPQSLNPGNILYVGGGGPGNYTTIQAAINNATNGDTIFVYNNTYNENIDTKLKKVTIFGQDRDTTIIQGQTVDPVVKISSSDVTITGFTMIGTPTEIIIQVMTLMENVHISNNIIKNGAYGISLALTTSKITISDNIIQNNAFIGIQLQTSSYNIIQRNTIKDNGAQGIELSLSSNHNSILNNSIVNNAKEGILIGGMSSTENTISGNDISGNQVGVRFTSAGSNTIKSNNIQGSGMEGVLLSSSNENSIEMNNFIDNKRQATFKFSSRNTWDANYWNNWIGFKLPQPIFQKFPKFIVGGLRINTDKHPAKQPYNITVFL